MQHEITVAFNFDDKAVSEHILNEGIQEVEKSIKQDVLRKLFESRSFYSKEVIDPATDPLSEYAKQLIKDALNEHKDAIIDKASRIVAESIKKTKQYRDAIQDLDK